MLRKGLAYCWSVAVAAFPDEDFTGKVLKKAPMADPEHWMNPDLKVYSTDVCIDGKYDFLKTGMTAKVEIIIDELKDVVSVPIQVVINKEGKKICYVVGAGGTEQREVETGAFNSDFVEIKKGLAEGEKVLLNPPRISESKAGGMKTLSEDGRLKILAGITTPDEIVRIAQSQL